MKGKEKFTYRKHLLQKSKQRGWTMLRILELQIQHHFKYIFQISFIDYDSGRRIETTLHNSTHIKSDVKKWLCFLREQGISKPQADLETVVLIDSKDEYNLIFFKK